MSFSSVYGPEDPSGPFTGPSPLIWGKMDPSPSELIDHPDRGFHFYTRFGDLAIPATNTSTMAPPWTTFLSDGATIASAGAANVSAITLTSDGDNEAAVMALMVAGIRITKGSGRQVRFETRLKSSTITDTKHGIFVGLFEPLTPTATSHIADDGTFADKNFIGFHRLEGDGDKIDIVYKADGQSQQSFTDAETLAADTYDKMGFFFDGDTTLKFYFNGVEYTTARLGSTELSAVTFPSDINLAPVIVVKLATGSTPGSTTINWLRFAYTNSSGDGFA